MINEPRGLQNGVPGGSGGGGGAGANTGGGISADIQLPTSDPSRATIFTLPVPIGTKYQVWQTLMSHRIMDSGSA